MNNAANNKSNSPKGFRPNKLTAILGVIIGILVVALIVMLFMVPKEEPVPETVPPTEPPVTTPVWTKPVETEPAPTVVVVAGQETKTEMLAEMAELYTQNADVAGWIKIDDTVIDYPVMHTPEERYKYLYMSFEGKYKYRGELFIDANCSMDPEDESQVILIHGHNMNDGSMFQQLLNYKSEKFWKEHPTISFKTMYEERTYEIFAAFREQLPSTEGDVFRYYEFLDPATEEEFNEGIAYFMEKNKYDMGIDIQYGDRLILLSTCDRSISNGRFLVIGRLVTEGEAETVPPVTE